MKLETVARGRCEKCGKRPSKESFFVDEGNNFYFCPDCELMFCEDCLTSLPLTGNPGYAMCPKCKVKLKRSVASVIDPSYEAAVMARFVDSFNAEGLANKGTPEVGAYKPGAAGNERIPAVAAPLVAESVQKPQKQKTVQQNQRYNPAKLVAMLAGQAASVRIPFKAHGLEELDGMCRNEARTPEVFLVLTLLFGHPDKELSDAVKMLLHKFAPPRGRSQEAGDLARDGERDLLDLVETLVCGLQSEEKWLRDGSLQVIRDFEMTDTATPMIRTALLRRDISPLAREALQSALVTPVPSTPPPSQPKRKDKQWWKFWK
jgi:hypothetical protein